MAVKDIVAKNWEIPAYSNSRRYSKADVTAPPAPANPTCTATDIDEITVDADDSVDVGSATVGYKFHYGHTSSGPYSNNYPIVSAQSATLPIVIAGLPSGIHLGKLTAVDAAGNETALASCTEVSANVNPGDPPPNTDPGNPLFFDDFDYVVAQAASSAAKSAAFQAAGWSGLKDSTTAGMGNAGGTISTETSIPGYSGSMPGLSGSGRILRMAMLPTTKWKLGTGGRNQSDTYLTYKTAAGPQTNVPGNSWFQFWIYVNNYGDEQSHFSDRNKLIYPSDDGTATGAGTDASWLLSIRPSSQMGVGRLPYGAQAHIVNHLSAGGGAGTISGSNMPEGAGYTGCNLQPSTPQQPNGWYLVKVHIDANSVNGTYEVWIRQKGSQTWIKTTEFIGGQGGFTWVTQPLLRPGHNLFKLCTTFGVSTGVAISTMSSANPIVCTTAIAHGLTNGQEVGFSALTGAFTALHGVTHIATVLSSTTFSVPVNGSGFAAYQTSSADILITEPTDYNCWLYFADFALATSEADLPTYGDY